MNGRTIMLVGFTLAWCVATITYSVTHRGEVPAELWSVYGVGVGGIWGLTKTDSDSSRTYSGRHRKD